MSDKTAIEVVGELLPEHRDRTWHDCYGFTWAWVKWASQEWDWGMRDADCLPWRRCFYDGHSYRSPFRLAVSGAEK